MTHWYNVLDRGIRGVRIVYSVRVKLNDDLIDLKMASPAAATVTHSLVTCSAEIKIWEVPADRTSSQIRMAHAMHPGTTRINCVRWNHNSAGREKLCSPRRHRHRKCGR